MCNTVLFELTLLISSGIVFLCIAVSGQFYIWQHIEPRKAPMHDVMFTLLPDLSTDKTPYPNFVFIAMLVVALLAFPRKKIFQLIAQYAFLQGLLSAVRGIVVAATLLPLADVDPACSEKPKDLIEALLVLLELGSCGDYLFSGHTVSAMLLYLFTTKHGTYYCFQFIQGLLLGLMMLTLLLFRWHYTIDIIIALFVSFLFFHVYKEYERNSHWYYFKSFVIGADIKYKSVSTTP